MRLLILLLMTLVLSGCFARSKGVIKSGNPIYGKIPLELQLIGLRKSMRMSEVDKILKENKIYVKYTGNVIWPKNPHFYFNNTFYLIKHTSDFTGSEGNTLYAIIQPNQKMTEYLKKYGKPYHMLPK